MDAKWLDGTFTAADLFAVANKRRAWRRTVNRVGKILIGKDATPRDCLIADISTGGVRLHVEGFQVPDEFVLLHRIGNGIEPFHYRVVWRDGHEIGARFVGRLPAEPPLPLRGRSRRPQ